MQDRNEPIELTADFVMKSENGVLLEFINARGLVDQKWFPLSQISDKRRVDGNTYRMNIPLWLAEDRGVV